MLRRAGLWHQIAAEFTRLAFQLPASATEVSAAVAGPSGDLHRTVL
jgi:hypothetical protein